MSIQNSNQTQSQMAFKVWEFSNEVQNELEQFLNIVELHSIPNLRVKNMFEQIHQTKIDEPSTTIINNTTKNVDVIVIDDDDNDCTQILDNTEITHDFSVLNLTCAASSSNDNLLNPDVNNFIEFIEENLEDTFLAKDDVIKLSIEYNTQSLTFLFSKLLEVISDQGLFNLNHSFCIYSDINLNNVMEHFCRYLLLPKIINSNFTQILQSLLKEISETYSQITRLELLIPLLKIESSTKCLQFIISILSETENQYFLRDFIYSCNELEFWQFETLQNLLRDKTEDAVKRRLITLMEASSDKFSNEKLFLKLVIKLIQNLGGGFDDQEEPLHNIIEKNKTLLKVSGQKALREWINKYNNY